jgi:Tol biopolymer transport system component
VKVLDFGLAKPMDSSDGPDQADHLDWSASPTTAVQARMTSAGVVVGTPAYMSPEQARGQSVDGRTDLWALGCALYEMLTAQPAFKGSTATDVLAAIVDREPDWQALPAATPPAVRRLLRRCLAKDLRDRFHHAGDVRLAIEDVQNVTDDGPRIDERRSGIRWWAALGAIATLSLAVVALGALALRPPRLLPEVRFETAGSGTITPNASIAISPDGRQVAVAPVFEGETPLWLRPIDSIAGRTLAGTEGAFLPFWSPDGRSIAFFAHRKLQRVDLESGVTSIIADASVGRGGAWASDGTIVFASNVNGPLTQVPATGGAVSVLTKLQQGQNDHRAPQFLPGETHFLYYARGLPQVRGVYVARRDGSESKRLIDADAPAVFVPPGQLLFVRDRTLFAQKFDPDRLEVSGPTVAIADSVALNQGVSLAMLAASPSGTVAYGTSAASQYQFGWFDRTGKRLSLVNPPNIAGGNPSLSPDGRSVAFNRVIAGNWDIWVLDLQREALTRITTDPTLEFTPIWTADGRNVIFQSTSSEVHMKAGDGTGHEEVVLSSPLPKGPTDISRDGQFLLFDVLDPKTSSDIWMMSLTGDRNPHPIVQTSSVEREGQFSPDRHWLAYSSNETGQYEVYVQPFPGPGTRVPASLGGGNQLRWGRRGTELFYIDPRGRLTAVPVTFKGDQTVEPGKPVPLFSTPFGFTTQGPRAGYVVSEDDQRFLFSAPIDPAAPASVVVMLNWRGQP